MKSKKSKAILIVLATFLIVAAVMLMPRKTSNTKTDEKDISEDVKSCDNCVIKKEGNTTTMNAYEYIISVMSAPQYWGVDNLPLYNLEYEQEYSYKILKEQNGTGWKLIDENKAVFQRGSEGVLTIDFSGNKASIKTWANVYSSKENNTLDYDASEYNFDYNKEQYDYIAPHGNTELNHSYDYEIVLSNKTIRPQTEEEFRESGKLFDERFTVKDIILYYEALFKEAGCPLLNMPEGTLESYKNKIVEIPVKEDDGLIHAIWKQEDFTWSWDKKEDIVWLDDYKEIFNKEVKDSEVEVVDWKGQKRELATYSPLFLVLVNKNDCTYKYINKDPNSATLILKLDEYFDAEIGAFATYFLKPMSELIYGYNGVYFYDASKLPDANGTYRFSFDSKEDFLNNLTYPKDSSAATILTIHRSGDIPVSLAAYEGDECTTLNNHMFLRMKQIAEYYGKDFPYAGDYMFNFYIYYNATAQRLLGLR